MGDELECWAESAGQGLVLRCDGCHRTRDVSLPNQVQFLILYAHEFAMAHRHCLAASEGKDG